MSTRGVVSNERAHDERELDERETTEDRELSDDDRFEMFAAQHFQSVLPDLPHMPGYHVMWLTTTNARDSIPNRVRMGYQLLRTENVPGWDGVFTTVGDIGGVLGVNEMVAARIPLNLYNRYMRFNHHTQPLSEEEKLQGMTDRLKDEASKVGSVVAEGDGTANIVQRAKAPEFTD
jgi:hypothetical protein